MSMGAELLTSSLGMYATLGGVKLGGKCYVTSNYERVQAENYMYINWYSYLFIKWGVTFTFKAIMKEEKQKKKKSIY